MTPTGLSLSADFQRFETLRADAVTKAGQLSSDAAAVVAMLGCLDADVRREVESVWSVLADGDALGRV